MATKANATNGDTQQGVLYLPEPHCTVVMDRAEIIGIYNVKSNDNFRGCDSAPFARVS